MNNPVTTASPGSNMLAHVADLDTRFADLQGMKQAIAGLARQYCGDDRPECSIILELAGDHHPEVGTQRRRSHA